MSYPPPNAGWPEPAAPGPHSTPPADPTLPMGGGAVPLPPAPGDPYAGAKSTYDPYGQPPPGYPPVGYRPSPPQNGLAIASMVVSIVAALGLCGYGLGGYLGIVGLALGYSSRRQLRERGEGGEGFATAGIIIGWITTAIAVLATIALVVLFVWASGQSPVTSGS
ncbi:DUF4190 domain-containing protein [Micromonospora mirobrigensis]|uniref:DUF4190 domain-containing protein n=1 Tax=Micromonospora mirobrigensis TaxID=262898 RepID=A0A1C4UYU0_9ACTN|nr:DUF4190 domain-containing protein [Micromonospora mirobrigensis]SCE76918.1 protein of unknown function (DUF4190) [Micromonospora mirobrigensis]